MKHGKKTLMLLSVALLSGCGGGGGGGDSNVSTVSSSDSYAARSGESEPLYRFQWALQSIASYFKDFPWVSDGRTDLNVDSVHRAGIKGQGVNVLVIDDGVEARHEDLQANFDPLLSWNFTNNSDDPTPGGVDDAHGTSVAGIIAAAQNGIGIMGIAPKARLGGAINSFNPIHKVKMYGGAEWSKRADVINFSLGENPVDPASFDDDAPENMAIHSHFPTMRNGKGALMLKAAGNEYVKHMNRTCPTIEGSRIVSCDNPATDTSALELPVAVVAAANARGVRATYSSAGAINWITGLSGETALGNFGEEGDQPNEGPSIFSTDLSGCSRGASRYYPSEKESSILRFMLPGSEANKKYNPQCNYSSLNGTSAATPTVTGVVALMLSANPKLGWRDVRDILRETARKIDPDYGEQEKRNRQVDLTKGRFALPANIDKTLVPGSTRARIDLGWQTNAAGYPFSNWYGFGLVDARAAVDRARTYTAYKPSALNLPPFRSAVSNRSVAYGQVTELGKFPVTDNFRVDALQLRLDSPAADLCIGSVGIYVKSPGGTLSALWTPYNIYYNTDKKLLKNNRFGMGSYAFYGESAKGEWTIYAVSAQPQTSCSVAAGGSISVDYRLIAQP